MGRDMRKEKEYVTTHCKHKDCAYRRTDATLGGFCNYCGITGEARGCKISECNKYEKKGKRKNIQIAFQEW